MAEITHPHDDSYHPGRGVVHVPEEDIEVETESAKASTDEEKSREANKGTMELMRRQLRSIVEGTKAFREAAADDARFRMGEFDGKSYQWVSEVETQRKADGRPCITINKAPGTVHQITNQARQARLRIHVSPVDDKGDVKVAEALQGMIRNVENYSFADRAYYMGSDRQAQEGLGYLWLTVEYASNDPDDLENIFRVRARIKQEMNPLSVFTDASAMEADFSDADFQFKVIDVDTETWKLITGKKSPPTQTQLQSMASTETDSGDWFPNGKIRMVLWFNREPYGPTKHMALMTNGQVIPYPDAETLAVYAKAGHSIKRDRHVQKRQMIWRTCDALDIHETTVWSGEAVPFIPVMGDALWVDGKRDFRGALRDGKSSAAVYNVHVSGLTESVGMGQKTPVVGLEGQFGAPDTDMRRAWENAHKKPKAFLEYALVQVRPGEFAPRPTPMQFELPMEGILMAIHQADEDYKTTTGQHDASLGERGPQESARAIEARKQQDELGNNHYLDNLRFSMASLGRQLIKVLRVTVDAPTVVRITGNDDRQRNVLVFAGKDMDPRNPQFLQTHEGPSPLKMPDGSMVNPGQPIPYTPPKGVKEILDIGTGEFDVEVNAGPDPGTRRQHELEMVMEIFKTMPPEMAMKFLDLGFAMIDSAVGRQLMERAKKMLPKELRDDDEEEQPIPPEALSKIQQLTEQRDMAVKVVEQLKQEAAAKKYQVDAGLLTDREERRNKLRIEALKHKVGLIMQTKDIKAEEAMSIFEAQVEAIMQGSEQEHAQQMSLLDARVSAATQLADHQIEQSTSEADRQADQASADADRQLQAGLAVLGHAVTASTPPDEPAEGDA